MLTKHTEGDKPNNAWVTDTVRFLMLLKHFFSF